MKIEKHKLEGASYKLAAHFGSVRDRSLGLYIIAHDTAGASLESTVDYITGEPTAPVSYHAVIGRDGSVTQMVPFDRVAYHAGLSEHPRKPWLKSLNRCSIGLAFDNPGTLSHVAGGYKSWFGKSYAHSDVVAGTRKNRTRYYLPYTREQIDAFVGIVEALNSEYVVSEVLSHYDVAPSRKDDTSPLFDPVIEGLNHRLEDKSDDVEFGIRAIVGVAGGLNLRRGPGLEHDVLEVLHFGAGVNILSEQKPTGYVFVNTDDGNSGWVHAHYLEGR